MARKARQASETGIYHIMVRGINGQSIFYDADDYKRYLEILARIIAEDEAQIYAYCLMSNHVHLLIHPVLRGWANYFQIANCQKVFAKLMGWIRRRLRMKQMREWKSYKQLHKALRRQRYKGEFKKRSFSPVGGLKGSSLVKTIGDNETATKENKRLFSVILVYWGKK